MVQFALFLVRLFKNPIQWLGVDFPQFEILLRTKLTLDFRRGSSNFQTYGRKKQTFLSQLLIYAFFGFLIGISFFSIGDIMLNLTICFTVIMVLLATTLISEFTTVLFDHRDNHILLPRPISHRTLLLLRLAHIQFYMGYIALALSLFSGIMVAIKYKGLAVLIFFVAVGIGTWITLIFTTFLYLLISKIVDGERFKDLITYVQIFLAVVIFGGYQLMPSLIDGVVMNNASMSVHWWTYFFPPAWFAALVKLSLFTENTIPVLLLSSLAILVPATGAVFLIRFLSKGFGNILGEGSSETAAPVNHRTMSGRKTNRISKFFCISDIEAAGWNLAVATTKRDRKFKQSVYPYFGMMLVIGFIMLKPDLSDLAGSFQKMGETNKYLFLIFIGYFGSLSVLQLPYSDTPEAAWIYQALPLKEHGHLLTGAVKALLFRFFLPGYLLITIPAIWIWGIDILPQIFLGGLCIILFTLITIIFLKMELPFTQIREMQQKGANMIATIFSLILMGLLAGLGYLTSFISGWITFLICGLVAGLIFMAFRAVRKRDYRMV